MITSAYTIKLTNSKSIHNFNNQKNSNQKNFCSLMKNIHKSLTGNVMLTGEGWTPSRSDWEQDKGVCSQQALLA